MAGVSLEYARQTLMDVLSHSSLRLSADGSCAQLTLNVKDKQVASVAMKEDGDSNTTVESTFTLTAPTSEIKFRQLLTGLYQAKNGTTAIGALGAKSTTRIAGSATAKDDGTYSSPLIEVVNE